jgi:hypothetical protein
MVFLYSLFRKIMKTNVYAKQLSQLLTVIAVFFLSMTAIQAQVTTSSISGKVKDKTGQEVPGASVIATYLPTGAKYGVASSGDGHFTIANMNPGGPYKIVVTFVGYRSQVEGYHTQFRFKF